MIDRYIYRYIYTKTNVGCMLVMYIYIYIHIYIFSVGFFFGTIGILGAIDLNPHCNQPRESSSPGSPS